MFGKCLAYPIKGLHPQFDPSFCHVVPSGEKLASDSGIIENAVVDLATRLTRSGRRLRIATIIVSSASFFAIRLRLRVKRWHRLFSNINLQGFNPKGKVPKVLQMQTCGRDVVVQFEKESKAAIAIQDLKRFGVVRRLCSRL